MATPQVQASLYGPANTQEAHSSGCAGEQESRRTLSFGAPEYEAYRLAFSYPSVPSLYDLSEPVFNSGLNNVCTNSDLSRTQSQ